MKRLLKIEWLKWRKHRGFWVLIILYLVSIATLGFVVKSIFGDESISIGPQTLSFDKLPILSFPDIWHNLTFVAKYFNVFLAILVIISITNELEYRTLRQGIINGLSRLEFIGSKWLFIGSLTVYATLVVFACGLLIGTSFSSEYQMARMFQSIDFVGGFAIYTLCYLSFAALFALIIKRSGLAIAGFLIYAFVVENIVYGLIKWQNDSGIAFEEYLPITGMSNIIRIPFGKYILRLTQEHIEWQQILVCSIYLMVFILLFYRYIKRKDW